MGRIKQSRPIKRRRIILEADDSIVAEEQTALAEQTNVRGGEDLAKAVELLRKTPPDQVEAAAAEATRLDLARNDRWIHLRLPKSPSSPSLTATTTLATVFDEKQRTQNDNQSLGSIQPSTTRSGYNKKTKTGDVEHATTDNSNNLPIYSSHVPSWSRGLGFARLASEDFAALQKLHQLIKDRIDRKRSENNDLGWASWSGSIEDPRKRAFGFLAGTWVSKISVPKDEQNGK